MVTRAVATAQGGRRTQESAIPGIRPAHLKGEDRLRMIAEAAYFRAERRDFAPGRDLDDWLAAEIEVDALFGDEAAADR